MSVAEHVDDRSVVSLVSGEKLVVCGDAEQVATKLNPAGATGGGLSVLDAPDGEVVLVNSRHVVAVRRRVERSSRE